MRVFAHPIWGIEEIRQTHSAPPKRRFAQWSDEDRPRSRLDCRHLCLALQHKVCADLFDRVVLVDVDEGRRSITGLKVKMGQRSTGVDVEDLDPSVVVGDDRRGVSDVFVSTVGLHSPVLDPHQVLTLKVDDVLELGELSRGLVGLNMAAHDRRLAQVTQVELCVSYVLPGVGLHK